MKKEVVGRGFGCSCPFVLSLHKLTPLPPPQFSLANWDESSVLWAEFLSCNTAFSDADEEFNEYADATSLQGFEETG